MKTSAPFSDLYKKAERPVYSFEFFPPKKSSDLPDTKQLISNLSELNPDFMTVTYGAGGATRQRTTELVSYISNELGVSATAHLTCVGHSIVEIDAILDSLNSNGIDHILALRGDPPKDQESFIPEPNGFSCARDLVAYIKNRGSFSIAVAGYPESHPQAASPEADLLYLKEKVEAGAELIITQLFFDAELYKSFISRTKQAGIDVPIVPGIMPISNFKQIERFSSMCGASIPEEVVRSLTNIQNDPVKVAEFGTAYALKQCQDLLSFGAPGIHFYTLNKSSQTEKILLALRDQ